MEDRIDHIQAREILTGTGRPTVEVQLTTTGGIRVAASVPSGTSKGRYEAFELYDGGTRFRGRGVRKAIENIHRHIAPALKNKPVTHQSEIDSILIELDGTPGKSRFGGNALLPVSVACAKAGALACGSPCFQYLGGISAKHLPIPVATVLAGGEHAPSPLPFEDYLLIPHGFDSFGDSLEALVECRLVLGEKLSEKFGLVPEVGGALSPPIPRTEQAFGLLLNEVESLGFGGKISLGLDAAANELYLPDREAYRIGDEFLTADQLFDYYASLVKNFPFHYLEDPFHQDDFSGFASLTSKLEGIWVVGDDLFASHPARITEGIRRRAGNALLLKINQIGTVTESLLAAHLASTNRMKVAVSVRSNETNDDFIAHFAVGIGAHLIKLGSPVRGERNAKYNCLWGIEKELGKRAAYAGKAFRKQFQG